MKFYCTSDTHFNHKNIIKYCNRPFRSLQEMHYYIIRNWNSIVKPNDLVFHLGDFAMKYGEDIKTLVNSLKGIKVIILGNHDRPKKVDYWKDLGFTDVYTSQLRMGNILFSHKPQTIKTGLNYHGHLHNEPPFSDKHINYNLENHYYYPAQIEPNPQMIEYYKKLLNK